MSRTIRSVVAVAAMRGAGAAFAFRGQRMRSP
jgi:hypothetical protein